MANTRLGKARHRAIPAGYPYPFPTVTVPYLYANHLQTTYLSYHLITASAENTSQAAELKAQKKTPPLFPRN